MGTRHIEYQMTEGYDLRKLGSKGKEPWDSPSLLYGKIPGL